LKNFKLSLEDVEVGLFLKNESAEMKEQSLKSLQEEIFGQILRATVEQFEKVFEFSVDGEFFKVIES